MDYFKDLADKNFIKEHPAEIKMSELNDVMKEYYEMGYREFKLTAFKDPSGYMSYKLTAKGDKEKIRSTIRSWYPGLIYE
jgi:hypothetical protein